jgi:cellulose synthase/poly-beta-1,6-N-acetylglucosamine synthase-like glycosyltransferase
LHKSDKYPTKYAQQHLDLSISLQSSETASIAVPSESLGHPPVTSITTGILDIIVPEYNEDSRQGADGFRRQLAYLVRLSRRYNVFLVDDASTDESWDRIVQGSRKSHPRLHLVRMDKNGQKVLAIKRALEMSTAEYVLLTDFDSRIVEPRC